MRIVQNSPPDCSEAEDGATLVQMWPTGLEVASSAGELLSSAVDISS